MLPEHRAHHATKKLLVLQWKKRGRTHRQPDNGRHDFGFGEECSRRDIKQQLHVCKELAEDGKDPVVLCAARCDEAAGDFTLHHDREINDMFTRWVEDTYHTREHSTLGMKPIDRFGLDLSRIIFLPPNQDNDELFHMEVDRQVKKDNTFSLQNVRFEAPCDLRSQRIQVRYDRQAKRPDKASVYFKGERQGLARPLDPVANDRLPRALKGISASSMPTDTQQHQQTQH